MPDEAGDARLSPLARVRRTDAPPPQSTAVRNHRSRVRYGLEQSPQPYRNARDGRSARRAESDVVAVRMASDHPAVSPASARAS